MATNFLKLNDDKTEFLLIGSKHQKHKIPANNTIQIGTTSVPESAKARNIGAMMDCHMSLESHVNAICRSSNLQLRHIRNIRSFLSQSDTETLIHAFVTSRLDNLNSLLVGLPKYLLNRLQRIQNTAARIVTGSRRRDHITPVLKNLHWLPIKQRIDFKILLLVFKCLQGNAPQYLKDCLISYRPCRVLRSQSHHLLSQPICMTHSFGDRAFSVVAPKLWNSLPIHIRSSVSLDIFKRKLKTHLFKQAFND